MCDIVFCVQIEKDFELMFTSETSSRMFEVWPQLTTVVLRLVKENVKDKTVSQFLSVANEENASKGILTTCCCFCNMQPFVDRQFVVSNCL